MRRHFRTAGRRNQRAKRCPYNRRTSNEHRVEAELTEEAENPKRRGPDDCPNNRSPPA
jgi:hypothetical protein